MGGTLKHVFTPYKCAFLLPYTKQITNKDLFFFFKWNSWFKTQHSQKMKIMASGPITSWEKDGETMERVADFIFLGSKIPADGDCSHEIKRYLLLGRKAMTNLHSILKSRDIIILLAKVPLVKVMVFPVVMNWCATWTIDKVEHLRIDAFELWC